MTVIEYDPKDRLDGAQAIADYLGVPLRRAYHMLEHGHVPAGQLGSIWVASKRRLAEHMHSVATGEKSGG